MNKYNKILFLVIFILSIFLITDEVNAFTVADYEPGISLFDDYTQGSGLPLCASEYEGSFTYEPLQCSNGTEPNIRYAYENTEWKYILRILYTDKETSITYYRFYLTTQPLVIRMNPSSSQYAMLYKENSDNLTMFKIEWFNNTRQTIRDDSSQIDIYNEQLDKYDISIATNYDLYYWNSDEIHTDATTGYEFQTDIEITVPINNYLLLIPRKTTEFSSYLWTDSNFAYSEMYYDEINSTYSNINGGGLNEINFGSLGGFNWLRWEFSFSELDLSFKKVIMLFNHSSTDDLHIKLFSDDFYYRLMNSSSSDYCVGDLCYKNDYDNFKNFAYSTGTIKNKYDTEDYENGISFIKQIPNMIKDFTKSFAFIGTLFSTFFVIFDGSIANYFYVIFGLMIIILIIKILK